MDITDAQIKAEAERCNPGIFDEKNCHTELRIKRINELMAAENRLCIARGLRPAH